MAEMESVVSPKPHAVFIPFPFQGHITPQMKIAQLFHQKGFYVTFVNTEFNQKQSSASKDNPFSDLLDFDFKIFNDGLIEAHRVRPHFLCEASRAYFSDILRDLIVKINEDKNSPPVSCIISDAMMPYNIDIGKELGVPCIMCFVGSAGAFTVFKHYNLLQEKGIVPVQEETRNTAIDFIPGVKNLIGRDLPFDIRYDSDFPMKELEHSFKASGIIFNTFESLEQDVLDAISAEFPHVYPIGALHLLQNSTSSQTLKPIQFNLWEEQHECLEWLDSMKPNSVLYISFGSLAFFPTEKLIELAWGILDSNYPFLWTMRPNAGEQDITAFPADLMTKIREKGFITPWSPQELVLNHPSIGGFLTHSGWNSTIESICAGVPMICWPQFGDHPIISRYSCSNWGIGTEMNADVKRDEVAKLVKDLMEGDHSEELKKKSMEWKKLAHEAITQGGSSRLNLEKLFKDAGYFSNKEKC